MRIAMLAGAVALAVPMATDAATYRLQYEGSASFDRPQYPEAGTSDLTPTLSLSLLLDIADGATDFSASFFDYAVEPNDLSGS